jgi:hypothetical protein
MVIAELPPQADSAGIALVWELIRGLGETGGHAVAPTLENGWGFAIKAMVVLLALLVLAVLGLCGAILYIFRRWEAGQAAGIKALSTNKDKTKQEITDLLKSELGNARAANAADTAELKRLIGKHATSINTIVLDLALVGQKVKMPMRSSPIKEPPKKEGG